MYYLYQAEAKKQASVETFGYHIKDVCIKKVNSSLLNNVNGIMIMESIKRQQ